MKTTEVYPNQLNSIHLEEILVPMVAGQFRGGRR